MKRIISSVVGLGLLVGAGVASAQEGPGLADLARQEQARRKAVKRPTKVYTNADVPVLVMPTASTATEVSTTAKDGAEQAPPDPNAEGGNVEYQPPRPPAGAGADGGSAPSPEAAEPKPAEPQPAAPSGPKPGVSAGEEAKWRGRITQAREAVTRAQLQLDAMRTRVQHLQAQRALSGDSGSTAQRQQDALQEYDRLRADVAKYQKALADVESEARQASVPAGWVR